MQTDLGYFDSYPVVEPGTNLFAGRSIIDKFSRSWMAFLLVSSDFLSLSLSFLGAIFASELIQDGIISMENAANYTPLLLFCLVVYALRGLYAAAGLNPVVELRNLAISTSAAFLLFTSRAYWMRSAENCARFELAFSWFFALVLVPLFRWGTRSLAVKSHLWGEPVAIIIYGSQGQQVVQYLLKNFSIGLRPVVLLEASSHFHEFPCSLPRLQLSSLEAGDQPPRRTFVSTAVLVTTEMPASLRETTFDLMSFGFKRLILVPNLEWASGQVAIPCNLEGLPGFEVHLNLLDHRQQLAKRALDFFLLAAFGLSHAPVLLLAAFMIRLDSPGRAFYSQLRLGREGRLFKLWKFRTMVQDADRVLHGYLEENPQARAEFQTTQKLKDDPRVTRLGRWLRMFSLDELPQLWNILRGDMSFVGPRPILPEQKDQYGNVHMFYEQLRPGLTGMWQVSGRNNTTFEERVRWDEYYVRNWSVWLDIYILIRTVWIVLRRDGAY